MNYYICLYCMKNNKNKEYKLLYGYATSIERKISKWHCKEVHRKLKIFELISILTKEDFIKFKQLLSKTECKYDIENYFIQFDLIERKDVISGVNYNLHVNKPTNQLCNLKEYWNVDKNKMLNDIRDIYNNNNNKLLQLIDFLNLKTGINFIEEGHRFGNFEKYIPSKYNNIFEIQKSKDNKSLILDKKVKLDKDVFIKFYSENDGRCIINKLKTLTKEDKFIKFNAHEEIGQILLEVWNESEELIFFTHFTYMEQLNLKGNIIGSSINIEDPWTKKLKESTKGNIRNIEKTDFVNGYIETSIGNKDDNLISSSKLEGNNLFKDIKRNKTKGAFISKTSNLDGEKNSYYKIKKLIDCDNIKEVIIADPYFSKEAASKILFRVQNRIIKIKVIASLSNIDPDNNNKNKSYVEAFKEYTYKNKALLHQNLEIINVLNGRKQIFHGRYLLRTLKDGTSDGYILSNSLNSAGQSYPFVIAPLENEIYLEVDHFFNNLIDEKHRDENMSSKNINIIYKSKNNNNQKKNKTYVLPSLLTNIENKHKAKKECIKIGYFVSDKDNNSFIININKYKIIIQKIMDSWKDNNESVIRGLGEFLHHSSYIENVEDEIIKSVIKNDVLYLDFLYILKNILKTIEIDSKISEYSIHSEEKKYYMFLSEKAEPNTRELINSIKNFYYGDYLQCLYNLLFNSYIKEFVNLMEELNSPIMLSIILEYIDSNTFNMNLYNILIDSKYKWMTDLTSYWIFNNYRDGKLKLNDLMEILEKLNDYNVLYQGGIILSEMISSYRHTEQRDEKKIILKDINEYIIFLAKKYKICDLNIEIKKETLKTFDNNFIHEDIYFKLKLIEYISDKILIDTLLFSIIDKFNYYYKNTVFIREKDIDLIYNFIECMKLKYEDKYIKELENIIEPRNSFFLINTPFLSEINVTQWTKARNTTIWEVTIIKKLKEQEGYISENFQKLLDIAYSSLE